MTTTRLLRAGPILIALLPLCACDSAPRPPDPVMVQGGTFTMGVEASAIPALRDRYGVRFPGAFLEEAPAHDVTLSDYRIDAHEVTNEAFARFVADNPEWSPSGIPPAMHNGEYLGHWSGETYPEGLGRHPVVFVTWHAAEAFCRGSGGHLPTEAQWEYAARGGGDREFPWGDDPPDPGRANWFESGIGETTPVGSYPPGALGLHDMAGNVWEWILDAWGPYDERPAIDPVAGGPVPVEAALSVEGRRVVRGASFGGSVVNLRTRWRDSHVVTNAVEFVGFRCAYPADSAR